MDVFALYHMATPNLGRAAAHAITHARDILMLMLARFSEPADLALSVLMSKDERRDMIRWLRVVELMVRRALFLEAHALARDLPPTPPSPRRERPRKSPQRARDFDLANPETWRVSFRVLPPAPRPGQTRKRPPQIRNTKAREMDARRTWPIACRVEALLRAVRDPVSHVQRLARRIAGNLHRFRPLASPWRSFYTLAQPTLDDLADAMAPAFDTS